MAVVVAVIKPDELQGKKTENGYIKGIEQTIEIQKVRVEDKDVNTLIEEAMRK
jgi:poly(3-hydroxyalkanoate) synthetase